MSKELDPSLVMATIGMQMDSDPMEIRNGEYSYCLCGTIRNKEGADPFISNIESNKIIESLPKGYMLIGSRKLDRNDTVCMVVNLVGDSEIGIFANNKYTKVAHDKKLRFSIRKPITIRFKTNYKGERIIYWTDDYNPPRWMNLDNPNFIKVLSANNCTTVDTEDLDLDFMKIFKDFLPPCITILEVTEDGQLRSGGYFITGQYADAAGNGLTAAFPLLGDIPIFVRSLAESSDGIVGMESDQITSKAIKLGISGADKSFTHINIIAIKIINGVAAAFKVGLVNTSTTQFVYNGAGNRELPMLLDDVIRPATKYTRAKTLETTNTQLLLGNLRSEKQFNFQPYFQKVQVQWQAYRAWSDDTTHSFKNPKFAAYMRCFRRDEVYALAGVIDFTDGTSSLAWHIPGRKKNKKSNGADFTQSVDQFGNTINPLEWDTAAIYSGDDNYDNVAERHKIYNTATIEGNSSTGADFGVAEYGEMGYYESTEKYDCNKDIYGDDGGEPIRFHKIPDSTLLHIHDGEDGVRDVGDRVKLVYMGLRFPNIDDVLATLPADIKKTIKGWRIVVGDRTYDKSVLASGIMLNALKQAWGVNPDGTKKDYRFYPNYPLNDLRPDPYTNSDQTDEAGTLNNQYNKDAFFFHSPDTHFKKQYIVPGELKVNVELFGKTSSYYEFLKEYPDFREKAKDYDAAAVQGYSIGWYNNYTRVPQNNTRRKLTDSFYVPFNSKVGAGSKPGSIWNVLREGSVFLGTSKDVANPTRPDTSRFIMTDRDNPPVDERFACTFYERKRSTALYYGTIKNPQPNQYGNLHDITYMETYPCKPDFLPDNVVFGGDTYIGKMNLKVQNVFFQNVKQFVGANHGIDGADFKSAATIPYPTYYYRNLSAGGNPRDQSTMMCEDNTGNGLFGLFGDGDATALGYLTMMLYGVPVFWSEADFNIDLRHSGTQAAQTFYPNLNNGSVTLSNWLDVRNIDQDNHYLCNEDFSFKNKLRLNEGISPFYDPKSDEAVKYNTRVVYSLKSQPEDIQDNWLNFQPLDYYDLPKNKGELIDIRYIGNYNTLFRMRDTTYIDTLYSELSASSGKVQLGSGKLFEKEPTEILSTENGYGGTVSQFAFNNTEFGPLFVSANSQKCFAVGGNLKDITEGSATFFNDNLSFRLAEQIKVLSVDNACNPEGIGLISEWDRSSGLWFVTKKDYEVIDANNIPLLHYKDDELLYLGNKQVSLHDKTIFRNRSWTYCYSPARQRWISFQPFIPNFYFTQDKEMYSGINSPDTGIYQHNIEGNYQTFYGKKYPFIIEKISKFDGVNTVANPTVSFISHALNANNKTELATFNKAIFYNSLMCSGLLNLVIQDELDLSTLFKELQNNATSRDVALRYRENTFNVSDFYDIFKHEVSDLNFFTSDWLNPDFQAAYPIDKVLNNAVLNYDAQENDYSILRDKWLKSRFIFDARNDIKLLLKVTAINNKQSIS